MCKAAHAAESQAAHVPESQAAHAPESQAAHNTPLDTHQQIWACRQTATDRLAVAVCLQAYICWCVSTGARDAHAFGYYRTSMDG